MKDADWTAVRHRLQKKYKKNDLDQQINSREFLEAWKRKSQFKEDNLIYYCFLFTLVPRNWVLKKAELLYTSDRSILSVWY